MQDGEASDDLVTAVNSDRGENKDGSIVAVCVSELTIEILGYRGVRDISPFTLDGIPLMSGDRLDRSERSVVRIDVVPNGVRLFGAVDAKFSAAAAEASGPSE